MQKDIHKRLPGVQEKVSLKPYTSYKIGGPAQYFYIARSDDEVVAAVQTAMKLGIPYFLLGGGTNILISDQGFQGLVIKIENQHLEFHHEKVVSGAGTLLPDLVQKAIDHGLGGLESLAGIGGTVGGAVRGNAGAFGQTIGDRVEWVSVLRDEKKEKFSQEQCQFRYRESIFKRLPLVILSVGFGLTPSKREHLQQRADEVRKLRSMRYQEDWQSAGCVFKNIDLQATPIDKNRILKGLDITEEEYQEVTKHNKLPVSFIIDKLGLKGKRIGDAQIAYEHGAFILNIGNATADQVVQLISLIKMVVRDRLGIQLEEEIQYVGFGNLKTKNPT